MLSTLKVPNLKDKESYTIVWEKELCNYWQTWNSQTETLLKKVGILIALPFSPFHCAALKNSKVFTNFKQC